MSLPEARSFTPHNPGPQEPSGMLIRPGPLQKTLAVHHCTVNKLGDAALNPWAHTLSATWMHLLRITATFNPPLALLSTINHSCQLFILESCVKRQWSTFSSDGAVKLELSPSCLCEPHVEMKTNYLNIDIKYSPAAKEQQKEEWDACRRNRLSVRDLTKDTQSQKGLHNIANLQFIIHHPQRAKQGHVKNKQAKLMDSARHHLSFILIKGQLWITLILALGWTDVRSVTFHSMS